jgi:diphosphomevalonate decarboxylase
VKAAALAHPNIALSKYWGKRPGTANGPAVPSLSVTLAGLATRTTVTFGDEPRDTLSINGSPVDATRATELLDLVRNAASLTKRATIVSTNDFPTASGLASSASGFAALAVAATRAAGLDWGSDRVADLARRSSASAARSILGGYVELDGERVTQIAKPGAVDLRILVCVTTEAAKEVSSRAGMTITAERSPYYDAWIATAPLIHRQLKAALLEGDIPRVGELAEESALAMHASALAAGVVYVSGATLEAYRTVRNLRAEGIGAWATMDAGPHLKCIVAGNDAARVSERLSRVPGVLRVIEAVAGEGARIESAS